MYARVWDGLCEILERQRQRAQFRLLIMGIIFVPDSFLVFATAHDDVPPLRQDGELRATDPDLRRRHAAARDLRVQQRRRSGKLS